MESSIISNVTQDSDAASKADVEALGRRLAALEAKLDAERRVQRIQTALTIITNKHYGYGYGLDYCEMAGPRDVRFVLSNALRGLGTPLPPPGARVSELPPGPYGLPLDSRVDLEALAAEVHGLTGIEPRVATSDCGAWRVLYLD